MVATLPQVKITTTNVPAILVTGSDAKGNEFSYRKSGDEWVDYYNESVTTPERIRRDVFPNVVYVRYPINGVLEYKMSRLEWIENGCPLDLPKSVVVGLMESQPHPVNEAQAVERGIDAVLTDSERMADMLSGDPDRINKHITQDKLTLKPYSSYPRRYSAPLTAEELENMMGGSNQA